ncbi:uncharacterized protein E0L32_011515 [Thyridium curvatum]|uniref:Uncharacterized protein n=1 Tax=Thyridium curvatum TaxID=1093900 RepID=A0A507BHC5_9PEZI|nr:uncharacterized protein E0L32_011515 [Thyridium curvatum]TPX18766.1 hypothetical protein E0L32_011515 [Thyridium curvatum]
MSSSKDRDDSLERELAYEDITMATGKTSKEKRDDAKKEKDREAEALRQEAMKKMMLDAGKRSKEKRDN